MNIKILHFLQKNYRIPSVIKNLIKKMVFPFLMRKKGLITRYPHLVSNKVTIEYPVVFLERVSVANDVSIGKYTYIVSGNISPNVDIGRYCSISRNVNIGGTDHPMDWLTMSGVAYSEKFYGVKHNFSTFIHKDERITSIGNDVWVGANVIIKRGVNIGDGAVIGAGSIVTKDVPPYAVVVGVPAKVIKYRFEEDLRKKLLEIKWWDLNEKLLCNVPWNEIEEAIKVLENDKLKQDSFS